MRMLEIGAAGCALLCLGSPPAQVQTVAQQDPWRRPIDAVAPSISPDGRYVAFTSYARLVAADTNDRRDVYVLDRADGRVTLESVTAEGLSTRVDSDYPGISADGRFVVYETVDSTADTPTTHAMLRDRRDGTAIRVNAHGSGERAVGLSSRPVISADGSVIAFASASTNLVAAADANGPALDVYAFDVGQRRLSRISVDIEGVQRVAGASSAPSISADGRYVAFVSTANLDRTATDAGLAALPQVYLRDLVAGTTSRISRTSADGLGNAPSWLPALSGDGRFVAFVSSASNLAPGDDNRSADVFVADLATRSIELLSRSAGGESANGRSDAPAISSDGRFVVFQSEATDLLCARRCASAVEDINLLWDVFVVDRGDRPGRKVTRLSGDSQGAWMEPSAGPAIDGRGELVVFSSRHPMDASDTRDDFDLFLMPQPFRPVAPLLSSPGPARHRPSP